MKFYKLGAIDIGSNAARLLITNVIEDNGNVSFKKSSLVRVPIRLGFDVFRKGKIGKKRTDNLISLLKAYRNLMKVHEVVDYRACATSAMRDAANGAEICEMVEKKTGIKIHIVDGKEEAEIIYKHQLTDFIDPLKSYIFVDIGGGSTEFTILHQGKASISRSFNIGTIRILNDQVKKSQFKELRNWLAEQKAKHPKLEVIGSGGNINKYFKLSRKKEREPLIAQELYDLYKHIKSFTYEERIRTLGLNPDRADVIVPAGKLLLKILDWTDSMYLYVPKIGVADGIVKDLHEKRQTSELSQNINQEEQNTTAQFNNSK